MFEPVNSRPDFIGLEYEMMKFWDEESIVQQYLNKNNDADKKYSFIDGPITANNPMGVHHAWGRTYKDLYQRYKTMQGYEQRYQNGFDGQGLWIEVEVEKELGFKSKKDIEKFGIDKFVELCKQRVDKFSGIQTEQSIRLGYWMDWDNSYHTKSDENNYTIWHFLKVCYEKGLLYEGNDVMPWCRRCGTGLSEHEIVTEGYQEVTHKSVFVKFQIQNTDNEFLIIWTTTPWTLPANIAAAVNPESIYIKVEQNQEYYYIAKNTVSFLKGPYEIVEEIKGETLVGKEYIGPFDNLTIQKEVIHKVIPWEEVGDEGTGIVHIAPGAGKEDYALGKKYSLTTIAPIDDSGDYVEGFDKYTGMNVSNVNDEIFKELKEKNILYKIEQIKHRYPVCWRCGEELVFRLVSEWFISVDPFREQIMDVTRKIKWIPEFGLARELDWLKNMDDWMISKKRYYGLALPIYKCEECNEFEVIGSEFELKERAIEGWDLFEGHSPHKPWVDYVKIDCKSCKSPLSRIKDVGNPWLDAGIVPYSTLKYRSDKDYWSKWFPADWISESFPGQFRNWFYSMLAMSTVLENTEPYQNVFSYALMRDEKGDEMHKSKGNAIWFEDAADEMGVDSMRWLYSRQNPANNLNFGFNVANEVKRRFLIPLWNVYSFFVTYANIDDFIPSQKDRRYTNYLDRWIISELNELVEFVTNNLDNYDSAAASYKVEEFIELLSNWYVRRNRRRFWKSENDEDKQLAYQALYECLNTLCHLLAPFMPFITDKIYQNLVRSHSNQSPKSVHLGHWPKPDASLIEPNLSSQVRLSKTLVSLGRSVRQKTGIRVRQPISQIIISGAFISDNELQEYMNQQISEELNVKEVIFDNQIEGIFKYIVNLRYDLLGPRLGNDINIVANGLKNIDSDLIAREVISKGSVQIDGIDIDKEELNIQIEDISHFSSIYENNYVVSLNTTLDANLINEGIAREFIHNVQNIRKEAGFNIEDRISIEFQGERELSEAILQFEKYISSETLALKIEESNLNHSGDFKSTILGKEISLNISKVI
tara:strand:- start:3344 stop:6469 length:3126 start_codon:yes stop_codon:yes gene_type:complete